MRKSGNFFPKKWKCCCRFSEVGSKKFLLSIQLDMENLTCWTPKLNIWNRNTHWASKNGICRDRILTVQCTRALGSIRVLMKPWAVVRPRHAKLDMRTTSFSEGNKKWLSWSGGREHPMHSSQALVGFKWSVRRKSPMTFSNWQRHFSTANAKRGVGGILGAMPAGKQYAGIVCFRTTLEFSSINN